MKNRIEGYDLARAIAVFGMVFVNFKIVLGSSFGSESLYSLVSLLEGRASALFVVLAGVGISLMTQKQDEGGLLSGQRVSLYKRGSLLIIFGLALASIWPADILHFYGFYFLISAFFINLSNRVLWVSSVAACLIFTIMLIVFDYEKGWDFTTLSYLDFWTLEGMLRHIFFNGFHPVFPWVSFIFIGMLLGRKNLQNVRLRRRLLAVSGLIWAGTELASKALASAVSDSELLALLGTAMMPPAPLYIIAASSLAVFVVCISVEAAERFSDFKGVKWLICTGQFSLTLYIAHIFIGMGIMDSLGLIGNQSIEVSVASALIFCCFGILFSILWNKFFRVGPVEIIFRKMVGS